MTERSATVTFHPDSAELVYKDGTKFNIKMHCGLYYLNTFVKNESYSDILKLKGVVEGMKVRNSSSGKPQDCNVCIEKKMTQRRNRNPDACA